MQNFITSSAMTRLLANIFIFLVLVASLIVAAIEVMSNQPINPLVFSTLSMGMVYAATILGMHSGVIATGSVEPLSPLPQEPPPDITRMNTNKIPVFPSKNNTPNLPVTPLPPSNTTLGFLRQEYQRRKA